MFLCGCLLSAYGGGRQVIYFSSVLSHAGRGWRKSRLLHPASEIRLAGLSTGGLNEKAMIWYLFSSIHVSHIYR